MAKDNDVKSGTIPASGTLTIEHVSSRLQVHTVESISIDNPLPAANSTTIGTSATGKVYLDGRFVTFFIPSGDTLEGVPVVVRPGQHLRVTWTHANPGALVQVTFWYDDGEGNP